MTRSARTMAAMRLRSSLLLALLASASVLPRAHAQAPLITGLGGPAGYGDTASCLSRNDDGSSRSVSLTSAFPAGLRFFGGTYTTMFVNTNGNITFNGAVPTYTPAAFPIASQPMIAPFWADVDIRREDASADPDSGCGLDGCNGGGDGTTTCASQPNADDMVWWSLSPGRIVVTWDRVGYYKRHKNHRMSFQLVLTEAVPDPMCGGLPGSDTNFDVEFRYNRCEWEVGDASGGSDGFATTCPPFLPPALCMVTPAQAGFDAGNRRDFVMIPGSRESGIAHHLCADSNVGETGVWRFGVRDGVVLCPDAGDPCVVAGANGVCAEGRTQCVGGGVSCVAIGTPSAERCDALDNDCDGSVDEPDAGGPARLDCAASETCEIGTCREVCFEGSCASGETCDAASGICVETACLGVSCGAGQRCSGGACVGACDGIVCPLEQECRAGRCIGRCDGVTCDAGTVCEDGVCLPTCPCRSCGSGESCEAGTCVDSGCAGVTCGAGTVCVAGGCVDACTGAVCPRGQMCSAGACVDVPVVGTDAGVVPPGTDGGILPPGIDGGTIAMEDAGTLRPRRSGCACGVASPRASTGLGALGLALIVTVLARRRAR